MSFSRRSALRAALGATAVLSLPRTAFAAQTGGRKLVVVVLRGGMDGLTAAPPLGDPAFAGARGALAAAAAGGARLDADFALHPKLPTFAALYAAKELTVLHAVGTPYRDRSHFDAQNVLETGATAPFARRTGWLNAALGALPTAAASPARERGLALAAQEPLILRGDAPVATWSPTPVPEADADTVSRLLALYRATDPRLAAALTSAQAANDVAMAAGADAAKGRGARATAKAAAAFLTRPDGPVAAVIEMSGWDTHVGQTQPLGPMSRALADLDGAIATLKEDLGPTWRQTVVLIVTEFGRTVAPNGSGGTDHGVGAAAFLAGGAVAGGRVIADWPGLARPALLDGRDLRPTLDLRSIVKGVLADHLDVARAALDTDVFPDSAAILPRSSLIRA